MSMINPFASVTKLANTIRSQSIASSSAINSYGDLREAANYFALSMLDGMTEFYEKGAAEQKSYTAQTQDSVPVSAQVQPQAPAADATAAAVASAIAETDAAVESLRVDIESAAALTVKAQIAKEQSKMSVGELSAQEELLERAQELEQAQAQAQAQAQTFAKV